ncbi:MAG: hypothetical protein IPM29_08750 [Planctomycetes bacterium]|nr:hypothetical protein [Planctomycetota bacterium]
MRDAKPDRLRRGLRVLLEIVLIALGFTVLGVILKGFAPLAPALAGLLRALLNPLTIVLVGGLFLLVRAGRGKRSASATRAESERDGDRSL